MKTWKIGIRSRLLGKLVDLDKTKIKYEGIEYKFYS
jgi:hypothetical protein